MEDDGKKSQMRKESTLIQSQGLINRDTMKKTKIIIENLMTCRHESILRLLLRKMKLLKKSIKKEKFDSSLLKMRNSSSKYNLGLILRKM